MMADKQKLLCVLLCCYEPVSFTTIIIHHCMHTYLSTNTLGIQLKKYIKQYQLQLKIIFTYMVITCESHCSLLNQKIEKLQLEQSADIGFTMSDVLIPFNKMQHSPQKSIIHRSGSTANPVRFLCCLFSCIKLKKDFLLQFLMLNFSLSPALCTFLQVFRCRYCRYQQICPVSCLLLVVALLFILSTHPKQWNHPKSGSTGGLVKGSFSSPLSPSVCLRGDLLKFLYKSKQL